MTKGIRPNVAFPELERRYNVYIKNDKSIRATGQALGISRDAVRNSIKNYEAAKPDIEFPDFPASDLPIERVIEGMKERSTIRQNSYDAHTWFPIKVKEAKPIGILFMGDPHIDDDGCDWTTLSKHIELCKQPGIYGVNIGDTTNAWAGRLVKKYADQETSAMTANRLAEWLMLDAGIRWLVFLLGNHDAWGDQAGVLSQMAKRHGTQKLTLHDWEARFSLNFPNGVKVNIWTAHDFPGDSQWNPIHGAVKAARFGPDVDLLVCGHKHNWGVSQWELGDKGTTPTMIRVRGYKFNDDYARRIGKIEQGGGASVFTVINPHAKTNAGRVTPFIDVEMGVGYLQFLRSQQP